MDPLYIAIMLFAAAVVLAFLDIFLPSGGILLVLCLACAVGSVLFGFRSSTTAGMALLTMVAASVPIFGYLAIKIWPHTPIGKRVILKPPAAESNHPEIVNPMAEFVGQVVRTESDLVPSGQLKIGHRRLNAISHSGLIEAGERVQVIEVRQRSLIVRKTDAPLTAEISAQTSHEAVRESNTNLLELTAEELGLNSLNE